MKFGVQSAKKENQFLKEFKNQIDDIILDPGG